MRTGWGVDAECMQCAFNAFFDKKTAKKTSMPQRGARLVFKPKPFRFQIIRDREGEATTVQTHS
jgi:hypothetical protein